MTIPTTAMPIIHDLDVIRVDVPVSALEPGLRTLVEKLSQDLHVARSALEPAREARDEYLDELEQIRSLLGAGPGVSALEAAVQAQKDIFAACSEANRLLAERDAALATIRDFDMSPPAESAAELRTTVAELRAQLEAQRVANLGVVEALAKERDEARAIRDSWFREHEDMRQERDEAIAFRNGVCALLKAESGAGAFAIVRVMASFIETLPALIEATNASFAAIEPAVRK